MRNSCNSSRSSLSNVIFENAGNDLNNEANADTSETELKLSFESERNDTKPYR